MFGAWAHSLLMQLPEPSFLEYQHAVVPSFPEKVEHYFHSTLYEVHGADLLIHPLPLVTHPDKKYSHSPLVRATVLSSQVLFLQGVVLVAIAEFQHLYLPLLPVKFAQLD